MRATLSNKDIIRIQKIIKRTYLALTGTTNGSSDCAQSIIEKYLKGEAQHQPIRFSVLDYLQLKEQTQDRNFNKKIDINDILKKYSVDSCEFIYRQFEIENVLDQIDNKSDRAIYILYYKWGLNLEEIGDCFNITASAIHLKLKKIKQTIKKRLKDQEL